MHARLTMQEFFEKRDRDKCAMPPAARVHSLWRMEDGGLAVAGETKLVLWFLIP